MSSTPKGYRHAIVLAVSSVFFSYCSAEEFAIRDGDTVVFLGDSITAARTYGRLIENYTLLRFPERRVRFVNAGQGGETAAGALKRLESALVGNGATLVTVAYGINDIGWGAKADERHKRQYIDAIGEIVEQCKKWGIRVYICSAAITAEDPHQSEDGYLQRMCDEAMRRARELGGHSIDVQRTMREIQKEVWVANEKISDDAKKIRMHADDGIHLNDLGQLAMAYAILIGLGAPAEVSSCTIDAQERTLVSANACTISDIAGNSRRLEFTRLDERLPLNNGLFFALDFRFVPIADKLNRYMLAVRNLPQGQYEISVDGRKLGSFAAAQLVGGVNVASATADGWQPGGPWDVQATVLKSLTEARDKLTLARVLAQAYGETEFLEATAKQSHDVLAGLESLQRQVVRPRPYRFVVELQSEPANQKKDG